MVEFMPGVQLDPRHEIKGLPAVGSIWTPACFSAFIKPKICPSIQSKMCLYYVQMHVVYLPEIS